MECPTLQETSETLHEGEEYEIDNSGCCTVLKKRCNKEKCTPQDECLENLEKIPNPSTLNDCCPKFMCGKGERLQIWITCFIYRYTKRQVYVHNEAQAYEYSCV